jgi:hypothetical protein
LPLVVLFFYLTKNKSIKSQTRAQTVIIFTCSWEFRGF